MMLCRCLVLILFSCSFAFADTQVALTLKSGRKLNALLRPVLQTSQKLPALLIFGGFQEAAHVLDLVSPSQPCLLASFDYPFDPPRELKLPGGLRLAPIAKKTIYETIEGIELLVSHLATRPEIDSSRISIIGASVGAPFAAYAGAKVSGLTGVVFVHGFGKVPQVISSQFQKHWESESSLWVIPLSWLLGWGLWAYLGLPSVENAIEQFSPSKKVLVVEAKSDSFIPQEARDSLWNAVTRAPVQVRKRMIMEGDHLRPGSDQQISDILRLVQAWGVESGLW